VSVFPWTFGQQKPLTGRELMLERMKNGIPPELAATAAGIEYANVKEQPEVVQAIAEGEILLFERARDGGVSGAVRAAMRYETNTWTPKAEPNSGQSLEDLLRD
jgi:hypothetical protein